MSVSNVGFSAVNNSLEVNKAMENYKNYLAKNEEKGNKPSSEVADSFEKSEETIKGESGIYSKENIMKTVEQIEAQRQNAMAQMISDMLGQQAQAKGMDFMFGSSNPSLSEITQADIDEAKASIEGDGFWSVNSVATRIMDMAKLLANGDSSKLETLKDAVIKGFGGAVSMFGVDSLDDMPQITRDTYTEVMKRFDDWKAEFDGEA